MKIHNLPLEDRKNLRVLRHTEDVDQMASILNDVLRKPFTLQALWEYRRWIDRLTPEHVAKYPILIYGIVNRYIIEGDLEKARATIDAVPDSNPYKPFCELTLPGLNQNQLRKVIEQIKRGGRTDLEKLLTAGRPSVLNALWDLTAYGPWFEENREEALNLLAVLYGHRAEWIYNILRAEILYWRSDCYDALVLLVGTIPFLKEREDIRLLFAAMTHEIFIMVINGQAPAAMPLVENLRKQFAHAGLEAYVPNLEALHAWCAMYDGDYAYVTKWLREAAPDERGKFCMLDLFRYMIKMRAYIIQGRYLAVTALAMKLRPLLEDGHRYMDLCQLHIIWAMSDYADGRKEEALAHMDEVISLSRRFRYDRLIADEAQRALELLIAYRKERGKSEYLERLIKLTEDTASLHPGYMKRQLPENPPLTPTELRVLRLLGDSRTNSQIAQTAGMAEETVKKHCRSIFAKLEVKNRSQAVQRAIELGILEPRKYHQ